MQISLLPRLMSSVAGVDDAASECDLDNVETWDHEVDTSAGDEETVTQLLHLLHQRCQVAGVVSLATSLHIGTG